jgi:hypothetical protein
MRVDEGHSRVYRVPVPPSRHRSLTTDRGRVGGVLTSDPCRQTRRNIEQSNGRGEVKVTVRHEPREGFIL